MKYRVFNKNRGCFLDPTYLRMQLTPSGQVIVEGVAGPNITQFFTGILDESGEEIFEGDILECFSSDCVFLEPGESVIGEVRWNGNLAMFEVCYVNGASDMIPNTNPRILGHINDGRNWSFV